MFEVLAKTGVKEEELAAIGITNQRETTVVWDKKSGTAYLFLQSFGSLGKAIPIVKNLNRKEKKSGLRKNAVFYLIHIFPQVKFAGS